MEPPLMHRTESPQVKLLYEVFSWLKAAGDEEQEELSYKTKPLYGVYHQQMEEVAGIKKSYQWLET